MPEDENKTLSEMQTMGIYDLLNYASHRIRCSFGIRKDENGDSQWAINPDPPKPHADNISQALRALNTIEKKAQAVEKALEQVNKEASNAKG